jgi:hypothetical protein
VIFSGKQICIFHSGSSPIASVIFSKLLIENDVNVTARLRDWQDIRATQIRLEEAASTRHRDERSWRIGSYRTRQFSAPAFSAVFATVLLTANQFRPPFALIT